MSEWGDNETRCMVMTLTAITTNPERAHGPADRVTSDAEIVEDFVEYIATGDLEIRERTSQYLPRRYDYGDALEQVFRVFVRAKRDEQLH